MVANQGVVSSVSPHTDGEQRLVLYGVSWEQYETLLDLFDDRPGLRMAYLEGALELMTTSIEHERLKTIIARLVEIFAVERRLRLDGYGSATFRKRAKERGVEPDECYCVGDIDDVPHIALEVVLTSGEIDKLRVYAGLGVHEVWFFRDGRFSVHCIEGESYRAVERSELLPELDFDLLAQFVMRQDQTEAVLAYRKALGAAAG